MSFVVSPLSSSIERKLSKVVWMKPIWWCLAQGQELPIIGAHPSNLSEIVFSSDEETRLSLLCFAELFVATNQMTELFVATNQITQNMQPGVMVAKIFG